MRFLVRAVAEADLDAWAELRFALWPHEALERHRKHVAQSWGKGLLHGWLAFDTANEVIGFAECSVRDFANGALSAPVPFLEGIWVRSDWHNKGVGAAFLEHVAAHFLQEGYTEICSDAEIENHTSHRAHQSWGFEETERVVYFRKPLT